MCQTQTRNANDQSSQLNSSKSNLSRSSKFEVRIVVVVVVDFLRLAEIYRRYYGRQTQTARLAHANERADWRAEVA